MRVIVCGTRGADEKYKDDFKWEIDDLREIASHLSNDPIQLVHGDCPNSPDQWCKDYYEDFEGVPDISEKHPANWKKYGKSAGVRRNAEMAIAGAEFCVAVWDSHSSGTLNMIQNAVRLGIPVRIIPCGG